jgi:predicted MFS family arabinose efflux permease
MSAKAEPNEPVTGVVLWPFFVGTFFVAAGGGMIFPLLADLQDAHDLPTWGLGVISALFFAGAVSGQLVLAPFADRGHTRRLLLGGAVLSVVAMLMFAFSTELWQFSLARLLSGLAAGSFLPATRATLVRAAPEHAGHLLGRYTSTETGGFVFGPVIGTGLYALWGLAAPFLAVAGALGVVAVLLARASVPPAIAPLDGAGAPVAVAAVAPGGLLSSLGLLRIRGVVVAVLLELAVFLPVGIYDSLWARYLQDNGATTVFVGVGLTLYGIPYVLWAPRGGRLADRLGPVRSATIGMLVVVPATALYGLLAAPVMITALALVEAFGNATAVPGAQTAMARSCPPERLAAGQGLSGSISLLAAGAAAAVAAPVYEAAGPEVLFVGAAAGMAALVFAARLLDRRGGVPAVPGPSLELAVVPEPT